MVSDKLDATHIFPFRRIRGKLNPRVNHLLPLALLLLLEDVERFAGNYVQSAEAFRCVF